MLPCLLATSFLGMQIYGMVWDVFHCQAYVALSRCRRASDLWIEGAKFRIELSEGQFSWTKSQSQQFSGSNFNVGSVGLQMLDVGTHVLRWPTSPARSSSSQCSWMGRSVWARGGGGSHRFSVRFVSPISAT